MIEIKLYNDTIHRTEVIKLWNNVFGYKEARNKPEFSIDKKLEVDDELFFVSLDQGELTGTVMAGYDGHRGWIYSMAVDAAARKKGVGSLLLRHAENALAERGCVKVNLQVVSTNQEAVEFYKKSGYSVEARISMGKVLS